MTRTHARTRARTRAALAIAGTCLTKTATRPRWACRRRDGRDRLAAASRPSCPWAELEAIVTADAAERG